MKYVWLLIMIILLGITTNCSKIDNYYHIKKILGKLFVFPDSLTIKNQGEMTCNPLLKNARYRIINYLDTTQCVPCESNFHKWQLFKYKLDSLKLNTEIIFVIWHKDYSEVELAQKANKCDIPCVYDSNNRIGELNNISLDFRYHTFLLDSLNKILLIGDPIRNKAIQDLYLRRMSS